jgi:hypothetical protein
MVSVLTGGNIAMYRAEQVSLETQVRASATARIAQVTEFQFRRLRSKFDLLRKQFKSEAMPLAIVYFGSL